MYNNRYINASDVPKLLGKEYKFFWTSDSDIDRIIFKKKVKNDLEVAVEKTLEQLDPDEASNKKRKIMEYITDNKKEITNLETHQEFIKSESDFISKLPDSLKKVVEKEFTMERGNVEENKIIKEQGIAKTNKLEYLTFKINGFTYKIGCRFDGPQIEIKTRKSRLLGVPEYENVQMHLYMSINKSEHWTLKEKFNDQIVDHQIFFNDVFFKKIKQDIHKNWEYYLNKNKDC